MQQKEQILAAIQNRLDEHAVKAFTSFQKTGEDAAELLTAARTFLSGGKRFRGTFCVLGFQAVSEPSAAEKWRGSALTAGCALECFHAAALIHDDIIDDSALRRGKPAAHEFFRLRHLERGGAPHAAKGFGKSSALLLGDLLQAWADELFATATADVAATERGMLARQLFNRMRTEVALGQYLDVLEENRVLPGTCAVFERHGFSAAGESSGIAEKKDADVRTSNLSVCFTAGSEGLNEVERAGAEAAGIVAGEQVSVVSQRADVTDPAVALARAGRVLLYKSAKYTVQAPLTIGAAIAGARDAQQEALAEFGEFIGVAFQLRDDLLGVFGDERVTGKPAGDDLRSGKRTVLIALARKLLRSTHRTVFDELFGRDLDASQLAVLLSTIRECGAEAEVERLIEKNADRALKALSAAGLHERGRRSLEFLAERVVRRVF